MLLFIASNLDFLSSLDLNFGLHLVTDGHMTNVCMSKCTIFYKIAHNTAYVPLCHRLRHLTVCLGVDLELCLKLTLCIFELCVIAFFLPKPIPKEEKKKKLSPCLKDQAIQNMPKKHNKKREVEFSVLWK